MSKKDDFSKMIAMSMDDDEIGGSLQGMEEYERFEVSEKKTEIITSSKKLVTSLIKIYFDADLLSQHEHLTAIADLETSNLVGLIESSRYAQHAVSTLMRKIDAGMHTDLSVYPILIELQKNALDIQMKVANYSRTLSPYLKSLKEDMDDIENSTIEILSRVETDSIDTDNGSVDEMGEQNFRGTMEMNKYFQEKMKAIEEKKNKRAEDVKKKLDDNDYTSYEEVLEDKEKEE